MATFCWKCSTDGCIITRETDNPSRYVTNYCPLHETPMIRDYKVENVSNTHHPSRDLYAEKKRGK